MRGRRDAVLLDHLFMHIIGYIDVGRGGGDRFPLKRPVSRASSEPPSRGTVREAMIAQEYRQGLRC